jgi:hypothetical protein
VERPRTRGDAADAAGGAIAGAPAETDGGDSDGVGSTDEAGGSHAAESTATAAVALVSLGFRAISAFLATSVTHVVGTLRGVAGLSSGLYG